MKIEVCVGSHCTMLGADYIIHSIEDLQDTILKEMELPEDFTLNVSMVKCMKHCKKADNVAPVVVIDGETIFNANSQVVMSKIMEAVDHD